MKGRRRLYFAGEVLRLAAPVFFSVVIASLALAEGQPQLDHNTGLEKAVWLRGQGRYEDSLAILEKEINEENSKRDAAYRTGCWLNMALDYWNLGEVSRSENAFIYVMALVGEIKDENLRDYVQTSLNIIKLYQEAKAKRQAKDYSLAEKIFNTIIEEAKSKGLNDLTMKCLRQLSFVYWDQNRYDPIREINEETLKISVKLNNFYEQVRSLNQLGAYYFEKKDILRSYDYFDRALVLAEKENLLSREPVVLLNLAVTSYQLGLYDLSEHYLERALEYYQKGDDLATTISLMSELALCLHKKGELQFHPSTRERPKELLTMALKLSRQAGFKEQEARMLNNLGFILLETEPEKARDLCSRSWQLGQELNDPKIIVSSLNNLATLSLRENDLVRAKELFSQALSLALKTDYWLEIWSNYYGLGRCLEKLGNYELAFRTYQKALDALTPVRDNIAFDLYRIGFDRGKRGIYEGLVRSLVKYRESHPGRQADNLVFSTLNNVKARVFLEEMDRLSSSREGSDQAEELNRIDRMISDFLSRPENAQDESSFSRLAELEYRYLRIQELNSKASKANGPGRFPGLEYMQKEVLAGDELILDFFLGQEESYCFLVSRDGFRVVPLPAEKEIEKSAKLYIKLLASPAVSEDDLRWGSRRIGQLLLTAEELSSDKYSTLIIIPDGILNNLPFETLIRAADQEGRYLLETHNIYYSPTLALVGRLQTDHGSDEYSRELLAFGNPRHNRWFDRQVRTRIYFVEGVQAGPDFKLEGLPFSQKEIKQLAELFPENSCDLFLRKKATEENLKSLNLSRYRIIHFACHGLTSEKFPQRSSLVLSATKGMAEDGFLTAREIYTLRLKAELVVLAACQSSRGRIETTEGIIGLPRIFLLTGSRAVVSTLWSVNDRASQALMLEFYQALLGGKSKAEALRQAKLKLIRAGKSHPYYWAGFVLTGNADRIY